ncbi:hypothetical protein B0H65DRAFT_312058 [Neurospora tetraspora]|uniref:Uncharacterized protein n=1 Tax=Neurospora tetraspora TaxID=94610 RepID=A0AAE0MNY9_9PEZI|nr:hypothetical protein B0H65DRAFT_312058 [Neurospora tetraspora]
MRPFAPFAPRSLSLPQHLISNFRAPIHPNISSNPPVATRGLFRWSGLLVLMLAISLRRNSGFPLPGKTLGRSLSTVTGRLRDNDRSRAETLFEIQFLLVRTIFVLGMEELFALPDDWWLAGTPLSSWLPRWNKSPRPRGIPRVIFATDARPGK